ncbi:D-alanine--D-alanine ligase family protein [Sanyastnella coralliicola]|uniref:D-alanine--D-alanine ligase family protein n=1 Tax=Sanyastnella coralliicola TaxID=3069118 RepID=UPI0027B93A59|nr:D-alanine--D-alanine ligase family protein [Longitalea sp. SCSIO 12813]
MKKKVAVLTGGFSGEAVIAERSAAMVMNNIDRDRYEPVLYRITENDWHAELGDLKHPIDKNDFSVTAGNETFHPDLAFVMIHGDPGENGILQGYFELLGLPYTTGDVLNMSITFSKSATVRQLRQLGYAVAKGVVLEKGQAHTPTQIVDDLGLPLFVKPNEGGSSIGMSKVSTLAELQPAIDGAFEEDDQVLVEQFLEGREVTCGVIPWEGGLKALPATEIITGNAFFDFAAKYEGESQEITPADVPSEWMTSVQTTAMKIYGDLHCGGMIRVDFMIVGNQPHVIEVNTVPGFSEASIVPQQAAAVGISKTEVISALIESALS